VLQVPSLEEGIALPPKFGVEPATLNKTIPACTATTIPNLIVWVVFFRLRTGSKMTCPMLSRVMYFFPSQKIS